MNMFSMHITRSIYKEVKNEVFILKHAQKVDLWGTQRYTNIFFLIHIV